MATKKIMVVPCMVNRRLKTWGETKSLCGRISWMRIIVASIPPINKKDQGINDVQNAQALVINGGNPIVELGRQSDAMLDRFSEVRRHQSTSDDLLRSVTSAQRSVSR